MLPTSLSQAPAGAASPSAVSVDARFAAPPKSAQIDPELAGRQQAAAIGLGAIRGLRYALAAEAVVVLAVVGLWRLWLTLR